MRIGLLFDFPQGDGGESFKSAVGLGLTREGVDRSSIEFVSETAIGHPTGTPETVAQGFQALASAGVSLIIGPSISDNCLAARDAADHEHVPAINYSGGERSRSSWMFHYQIGSLEEEPPLLVDRLVERDLRTVAIIHDVSVVGSRYREVFGWAASRAGIDVLATASIDPVAVDVGAAVAILRAASPGALIYLGLGASSLAVATAVIDAGWSVPVLANSALMFGYLMRDWRDAWRGWEYVDTIADDNLERAALRQLDARAAAGSMGCAAYDMGRLVGAALGRADDHTRSGLREGLERVKLLAAASGHAGTLMGFGVWDRAALKGPFLVIREWRDGRTIQVPR